MIDDYRLTQRQDPQVFPHRDNNQLPIINNQLNPLSIAERLQNEPINLLPPPPPVKHIFPPLQVRENPRFSHCHLQNGSLRAEGLGDGAL
jgi:hypothetical protein